MREEAFGGEGFMRQGMAEMREKDYRRAHPPMFAKASGEPRDLTDKRPVDEIMRPREGRQWDTATAPFDIDAIERGLRSKLPGDEPRGELPTLRSLWGKFPDATRGDDEPRENVADAVHSAIVGVTDRRERFMIAMSAIGMPFPDAEILAAVLAEVAQLRGNEILVQISEGRELAELIHGAALLIDEAKRLRT